jgi:DNA primase
LPGPKAIFNGTALSSTETLFIAEGLFDALSLIEAGFSNAVAIFGIGNLRWSWVKAKTIVVAFDFDAGGRGGMRRYIDEAVRWGKEVLVIDKHVFDGHKDLNDLWVAKGRIDLEVEAVRPKQDVLPESPMRVRSKVIEPKHDSPLGQEPLDLLDVPFDYDKVPTKPRLAVSLIKVWNHADDTA